MSGVADTAADLSPRASLPVRWFAHLVSYVFHPLFIPVYATLFVLYVHPLLFAGYTDGMKVRMLATVFVNLTMLPAATVFLCWRLKFVTNLYMDNPRERVIPLAAAMIFYFWCWYVLKNNAAVPEAFRMFLLGSFLTIIAAWLTNIVFKVSLHALAVGGLTGFMLLLTFGTDGSSAQYLGFAVAIAGLVCSARLLLSSHYPFDVYAGFIIGATCQVLATIVS